MPAKGTRNPYTKEDDGFLWDWVTAKERKGGHILGNEIYKQLEEVVRANAFLFANVTDRTLSGYIESTTSLAILARSMGKDTQFQTASNTSNGNRTSYATGRSKSCHRPGAGTEERKPVYP